MRENDDKPVGIVFASDLPKDWLAQIDRMFPKAAMAHNENKMLQIECPEDCPYCHPTEAAEPDEELLALRAYPVEINAGGWDANYALRVAWLKGYRAALS